MASGFSSASSVYHSEAILQKEIAKDLFLLFGRQAAHTRVVDLGCGTGFAGELFLQICKNVIFCDINKKMLAECQKRTPETEHRLLDLNNHQELIAILDKKTTAVASMSLQWTKDPISTIKTIVNKSRSLLFSLPVAGTLSDFYIRLSEHGLPQPDLRLCPKPDLLSALEDYGQSCTSRRYIKSFNTTAELCTHLKKIGVNAPTHGQKNIGSVKSLLADARPIDLVYDVVMGQISCKP